MKKFNLLLLVLLILFLFGCSQSPHADTISTNFADAIPVDASDTVMQTCIAYAESLGYEAGKFQKSVLLGSSHLASVYCEDTAKESMIDENDLLVIFDGIRCVVDADTQIVLGRIPYV